MKKWFLFFFAFAFVVFTLFCSYLYLYRAEFTSQTLSKIYKTPVKVERIRVTNHDLEFQNIELYGPTNYVIQPTLQIDKAKVKIPLYCTLFALLDITPLSIRKVSVVDPKITLETIDDKTNWTLLLENLLEAPSSSRRYYVETVEIQDLTIEIRNKAEHHHTKHHSIPAITLTYNSDQEPRTPANLIYWATTLALAQAPENPLREPLKANCPFSTNSTCHFSPKTSKLLPIIPE